MSERPEQDWRHWLDRDRYVVCNGWTLNVVHMDPNRCGGSYRDTWNRRTTHELTLLKVDEQNTDKYYWRSLKRFLLWLFEGKPFAVRCYKQFRRVHHESKQKKWDDVLPPKIVHWASREIQRRSNGLDCVDNARVARVGNTAQVRRYRMQHKHGCCGFEDWQALGPDGKVYMLGFNFGH